MIYEEQKRCSSGKRLDYMRDKMNRHGRSSVSGKEEPDPYCVPEKLIANSIGGAIKDFMDDRRLRELSGNTLNMYRDALCRLESYLDVNKSIDKVTLENLREFMKVEESRGLSKKTMKTRTQCVKSFFRWLVDEEFIDKDPSKRLPQIRLEDKVLPPLSVEEVQIILNGIDVNSIQGIRDRLLILLLADSGARVSEAISIKLKDLDLDAKRIRIMGKGSKERYLRFSNLTKLELGRFLRKLQADQKQDTLYLFENPDTGMHITRGAAYKIVRRSAEKVGLHGVHPHQFRRSFTSEYISSGGDLFTLQKELGHTDLQMVRKYASIYDPDVDRKHQEYGLGAKLKLSKVNKR